MKTTIIDKINEIAKLPVEQARKYDTAITWALVKAVS